MQINLFATIAELKQRLKLPRSELDFVSVINLLPPRDWTFVFTFVQERLTLSISTSSTPDAAILVKGATVSVLDGDEISLQANRMQWTSINPLNSAPLDSNTLTLLNPKSVDSDETQLVIFGFNGNNLPSVLSRTSEIYQYLLSHTWVGSSDVPKAKYKITFKVLGTVHQFANSSQIDGDIASAARDAIPTLKIEKVLGTPPIGKASFKTFGRKKNTTLRWTNSGIISSPERKKWLGVDANEWPSGDIEITVPHSSIAPDGAFSLEGQVLQLPELLHDFVYSVSTSPQFAAFQEQCATYEKEQSANLIDKRKNELLSIDYVYHKGNFVYRVPSNESELVSLHQKLEGMRALPLAEFASLEYTAKLGIDAIVNFKIRSTDSLTQFATVEFEFHYENFFLHGHPVEQTNLIICWDRRGTTTAPQPVPDEKQTWLSHLSIKGHTIRVIEVSKYPGLSIRKIQGKSS